jgi:hypothetical protein
VYQNKFYIGQIGRSDLSYLQIPGKLIDLSKNTLQEWPQIPHFSDNLPSMILWKDTILAFDEFGVQSFNLTTNKWSTSYLSLAPKNGLSSIISQPKLAILPNDEVLVIGSPCTRCSYFSFAYVYSITGRTWSKTGLPANDLHVPALIQLGTVHTRV